MLQILPLLLFEYRVLAQIQTFTSSGSYTVPAGTHSLTVRCLSPLQHASNLLVLQVLVVAGGGGGGAGAIFSFYCCLF